MYWIHFVSNLSYIQDNILILNGMGRTLAVKNSGFQKFQSAIKNYSKPMNSLSYWGVIRCTSYNGNTCIKFRENSHN